MDFDVDAYMIAISSVTTQTLFSCQSEGTGFTCGCEDVVAVLVWATLRNLVRRDVYSETHQSHARSLWRPYVFKLTSTSPEELSLSDLEPSTALPFPFNRASFSSLTARVGDETGLRGADILRDRVLLYTEAPSVEDRDESELRDEGDECEFIGGRALI